MIVSRPACRLASIAASIVTVMAGCTAPEPAPESLVIGVLSVSAASAADPSNDAVRGAQLAIDVVNDSHPSIPVPLAAASGLPSLGGVKLTLAGADTNRNADEAAAKAAGLVNERGAVGVVIADSAAITAASASQMQRMRVPLVDAYSTADYLTELGMDWYFRSGPGDRMLAESAFALLRRQFAEAAARPRIAVVTQAGGDSASGAAHLKDLASREGITVAMQHECAESGLDAGLLASRLSQSAPDAVFAWAHTDAGAQTIGRIVGGLAGSPPVLGLGHGFRQLDRPATAKPGFKPALLRAVSWSAELARRGPAGLSVMELYERRFGRPMTDVAAAMFTAVIALAAAIDTAGSADPAAIRTALRQTSLPATQMIMPWNGVRFGSDGRNQLAAAVLEAWDGNAFRVVYPAELASTPLRWTRAGAGT